MADIGVATTLPSMALLTLLILITCEVGVLASDARPTLGDSSLPALARRLLLGNTTGGVGVLGNEKFVPHKIRTFDPSVLGSGDPPIGPSPGESCSRWVVAGAAGPVTPNLQALADLSGWCKVFILDNAASEESTLTGPGVKVLTAADKEALPWRTARLVPWGHFGRKTVGYLYALTHGAEVIYDTDAHNILERSSAGEPLLPSSLDAAVELHLAPASQEGTFNPLAFWGARDAWPRGFPLAHVNSVNTKLAVERAAAAAATIADALAARGALPDGGRTCILQSLASGDPDVDAVYRMTRSLPLYIPALHKRLVLPPGVYAPANAQATLLAREVAAGMLLPVTVHGAVADVLRSYVLQRAMWDGGCRLAFADPWVRRYGRPQRGRTGELQAEMELHVRGEGLLQILNAIDFGGETDLGSRVLAIYVKLYEYGLVEELDVKLVHAYLTDLDLLKPVAGGGAAAAAASQLSLSRAAGGTASGASAAGGPRAVVCVTGKFRGGPFTIPLIRENVLEALGMPFDVVAVTPRHSGRETHDVVVGAAGGGAGAGPLHASEGDAAEFLYLLPNLVAVVHPDYSPVEELLKLDWALTGLDPNSVHTPAKLLSQMVDLSACNDAIRSTGVTYTHAVRVRADTLVMGRLSVPPGEVPPGHVVVPNNEDWGGVNDRFAYGNLADMMHLFGLLQAVPRLLPRGASFGQRWNAEVFYMVHGQDGGVTWDWRPVQLCRLRRFVGGVLVMDEHDAMSYPVCGEYCKALRGCVTERWRHRR